MRDTLPLQKELMLKTASYWVVQRARPQKKLLIIYYLITRG